MSSRSKNPNLFMGILHQAIGEYAKSLNKVAQEEWGKIQGRFLDLPFSVGVDDSSIEISSDALRVKALGITNAMLAGSIALGSKVTGTLPIANGGTGLSSYTAGDMVYYASSTSFTKLGIGGDGTFLTSDGSAPSWTSTIDGGTF